MEVSLLAIIALGVVVLGGVFFLIFWWTGSDKNDQS